MASGIPLRYSLLAGPSELDSGAHSWNRLNLVAVIAIMPILGQQTALSSPESVLVESAKSQDPLIAEISSTLEAARPLATQLGLLGRQLADLDRRLTGGGDLIAIGEQANEALSSLQAAHRERSKLLLSVEAIPLRVSRLHDSQRAAATIAKRCRAEVVQCPAVTVPIAGGFDDVLDLAEVSQLPFTALRARVLPILARLDRLEAAVVDIDRTFRMPVEQRAQSVETLSEISGRAIQIGRADDPLVQQLQQVASDLVSSVPCDLEASRQALDRYRAEIDGDADDAAADRQQE